MTKLRLIRPKPKRPFGDLILAELRRVGVERGITQEQIAEQTGMSTGTISRLLNGKRDMCFDDLVSICRALGVSTLAVIDNARGQLGDAAGEL